MTEQQYGPPQRFKAIHKATGVELDKGEACQLYMEYGCSGWRAEVRDVYDWACGALCFGMVDEVPFDHAISKTADRPQRKIEDDYVFMQSTGLRDATRTEELPEGREVFFGDVVVDQVGRFWKIMWKGQATHGEPLDSMADSHWVCQWHADRFMVIGNIYQPANSWRSVRE